ncbi:MAG: class I SAM-dependent methyltransferase [Candidatus Sumerlaeota bacterium]|nr:class I SAM-dependent methyltransferase [Candidatus Sumerlaeota bacterium]
MNRINCSGFIVKTGTARFSIDWRLVAPESLFTTIRLLSEILAMRDNATGIMLDVGCGTKPYCCVFEGLVTKHIGVDVPASRHDHSAIDAYSSALHLPFCSESFDFVLCTEVLEHLPDPLLCVREISRVLKQGGRVIFSTPFMYRIHESPYDFYRYTCYSYEKLSKHAGLELLSIKTRGGYASVLCDILIKGAAMVFGGVSYVSRRVFRTRRHMLNCHILRYFFCLPQYLLARLLKAETIKSSMYTLGYVVLMSKPDKQAKSGET